MKVKIFLSMVFCFTLHIVKLWSQSTKKPNFVLIVADDLGFGDLSINGSSEIRTPNIDRLAAEGVLFSEGYVSSSVSSPSRAGFLTGRNQVSFGHDNNIGGTQPGFDSTFLGLPLTQITIADRLKEHGYVNGLIGKWHLGDAPQFHPLKRGFDEFWGYTGGGHDYFNEEPNGNGYLSPLESNYKTPQRITYLTDNKGDECVEFIKRHKNESFFLFASFNAPHTPMQATEADLQLYSHIKDKKRRTYCSMVHRLDVNIGRIIKTLESENLINNTLIVFISDNGGPCNQNRSINAPYRGQKGTLLEGGIHVPFIMKWRGRIPAGEIYPHPVSSLDIAPTFLSEATNDSLDHKHFDGVNLIPYITKENIAKPHNDLKWRFTISAAIREGDWKLIRLPDRLPLLYNLAEDPSELKDLSLKHLARTKTMLKQLGEWDIKQPHPVFLENAIWKSHQIKLYNNEYQLKQPQK